MYTDKEKIEKVVEYINWCRAGKFTSPTFDEMASVVLDEKTEEEKLKPCPFCGKEDSVHITVTGKFMFAVICDTSRGGCGATTDSISGAKNSASILQAIKLWNKRT